MHCKACDCELSDKEATRRSLVTHEYFDMCDKCLGTIVDDVFESVETEDYIELIEGDQNDEL